MSRVSALYRLQEIDLEWDELNVRLDEIRTILEDGSELRRLKQDHVAATEGLSAANAATRTAQHTVEDQRLKIEQTKSKLYGGQVQNPKELQDLQLESASLKRHLETLEDRYLETLLAQDEAIQAHSTAQSKLERLEADQATAHAELIAERAQIEQRRLDVQTEREAALIGISDEDLEAYNRLRERHGGLALALLDDDACSACGLTVSAATQQTIRAGSELVTCGQCHRVLYGG